MSLNSNDYNVEFTNIEELMRVYPNIFQRTVLDFNQSYRKGLRLSDLTYPQNVLRCFLTSPQ